MEEFKIITNKHAFIFEICNNDDIVSKFIHLIGFYPSTTIKPLAPTQFYSQWGRMKAGIIVDFETFKQNIYEGVC